MPAHADLQTFDPLSQALDALGLRAEMIARVEASGAWGIDLPEGSPYFHAVIAGRATVVRTGNPDCELSAGEILFTFDGGRRQILGGASDVAVRLETLIETSWIASRSVLQIGEPPADTILYCGTFSSSRLYYDEVLGALPIPILVSRRSETEIEPIATCLALLKQESGNVQPGTSIVCARLIEVLLVFAIRQWLERSVLDGASWLRGLSDPVIGRALSLIHSSLGEKWDVATLASRVGLSRSAFAARFTELIGESPAKYIVRWRMIVAKTLLLGGNRVGEVAFRMGYESESAFSRAFRRVLGHAPSSIR